METLTIRQLSIDPATRIVREQDREVRLKPNEFDILLHFVRRPNQVLTRQALVDEIRIHETGRGGMVGERTIDRRIARLRKALGDHAIPDPIRTVYGIGYVFDTVA